MDQERDRRLREAVQRKMREAEAASEANQDRVSGDDEENLPGPSQPEDTVSPRERPDENNQ